MNHPSGAHDSLAKPPNILLLMADQLTISALGLYGNKVVKSPHLDALAERSVVFDSAYCNFPICAPSRFSMLSGRLPHVLEAYDNASEFPSSIPTMAHYLADQGYHTILCGKMHFIGADQRHGFAERLTTDIYPADFSWTPDWRKGPEHRPTGVSMRPVLEAGPCIRSMQVDYDDEVEYNARQKLYDLARAPDQQPFFLTVSFTHPHPPFVAPEQHWQKYRREDIPGPQVPPIAYEDLDPHSQWLYIAHAQNEYSVSDEQVLNARHAYYGMVSYVDEKIGQVLATLKETGLDRNTVIVFAVDHGEMLGERGMWFKQTFFEDSVRVPLMLSWPEHLEPRRVAAHVSLVDLLPTFMDIAMAGQPFEPVDTLDGASLLPLARGEASGEERVVISEYSSEGVCAPSRMVRQGDFKLIHTRGLPALLFDLRHDPLELHNLAESPEHQGTLLALDRLLRNGWDPEQMHQRILSSQHRRLFLARALARNPHADNWAYQPFVDESKRFIRGSGAAGPTTVKARSRFPFVEPAQPDRR